MKKTTEQLKISHRVRGELLYDEPMSKHTSWRVGGPADYYFKPADIDDLSVFLDDWKHTTPLYWVGLGSNLLVRDAGIRGTVIVTTGLLSGLAKVSDNIVRAEAGVACPKVSRFSAKQNLVGAEFLSGIPGTIGGALAMNAGAFGGETWGKVESVETIDLHGKRSTRYPSDYRVAYRSVTGPANEWFVAANFKLESGDGELALQNIKQYLDRRNATQPTNQASCGSVFRNPDGDYAARLIEVSGLKGFCIGDACVSEKHANFIINTGSATASDIESLISYVQQTVKQKQHIDLVQEAHVVGEPNVNA